MLAGGSFLKEAKNILYDQDQNSQSLAVTTLLDSPQYTDTLFTMFPSGGYTLGHWGDMPMEASVYTTAGGYPQLSVRNGITSLTVARVQYRMENAQMILCPPKEACVETPREPSIFGMLKTSDKQGFRLENQSGKMTLTYHNRSLVSVDASGVFEAHPSVTLVPRQRDPE